MGDIREADCIRLALISAIILDAVPCCGFHNQQLVIGRLPKNVTPKLFPILILALIFIAPSSAADDENAVKVVPFINGARGDESFFDSAAAEAEADFGIEVATIEAGYSPSAWGRQLEAAAGEDPGP